MNHPPSRTTPPAARLARPDTPDAALPGEHPVGVLTFTTNDPERDRVLTLEAWYPADGATSSSEGEPSAHPTYADVSWQGLEQPVSFHGSAVRDAVPAGGRHPVIVYAHGAPGSRLQSTRLCEHLASHGCVVLGIDFTNSTYGDLEERSYVTGIIDRPLDVRAALDALERHEQLGQLADTERSGIVGYSFGGYTALVSAGARIDFARLERLFDGGPQNNIGYLLDFREWLEPQLPVDHRIRDERIRAAFVMAPWNGPLVDLSEFDVPLFIAAAELDAVAPLERDARRVYESAPGDAWFMTFERGGHNLFTDPYLPEVRASAAAWEHCCEPVWDKERTGDILKAAAVSFFLGVLSAAESSPAAELEGIPGIALERKE